MEDHPADLAAAGGYGHVQPVDDQFGAHVVGH
jgi:hypothetical protein